MMLMLLVAVMGLCVQSCGDDDNLSMYTIQAKLVDKGNLGADAVAQINPASFPTKGENDVNAIYTIKIYITNSAGKEIYSRMLEIKDGEANY